MATQTTLPPSPDFQQAILDSTNMAMIATDLEGMVCTFNRAAEQLLGYPAREVVGRVNWTQFHDPEELARLLPPPSDPTAPGSPHEILVAGVRQGETEERQRTYIRRDGTAVAVWLAVTAIRDETGRAIGFLGVAREDRTAADLRGRERYLHNQQQAQVELARCPEFYRGDLDKALQTVTRIVAHTLEVARVSVWFYSPTRHAIRCADLYDRDRDRHGRGVELTEDDYPSYFAALETHRPIVAADARTDPRTQEFTESYLEPLDIGAMLDTPIRSGGKTVGVVCLEHIGGPRRWTQEDQNFTAYLADWVTLALEAKERAIAETALQQSQRQLQAILDRAPAIVYLKDLDGRYLLVNREYERRFGLSRDRVRGRTDYDLFPPEMATVFEARDRAVLDRGEPVHWEEEIPTSTGFRSYLSHRFPLEDGAGEPHAICCLATDITDRKLSEAALRESEATKQALLDAIPDLILHCRGDGTVVDFKPPSETDGWAFLESPVGQNIQDLLPPEVARAMGRAHDRARFSGQMQAIEYQLPAADGGEPRHYEARIVARNAETVISIVRDITERQRAVIELKKASEALQSREEQLQLALEGSALGLWDWNITTGQAYFDPRWKRVLGYSEGEIENTRAAWRELIPRPDRRPAFEALNDCVKGRTAVYHVEVRMRNRSGGWQWMLCRGKVFEWDDRGRPVRMTGTYKDISDRKQAELEVGLLRSATRAIAGAPDFHTALGEVLRLICTHIGWDVAEAWVPAADGSVLDYCDGYADDPSLEGFLHRSAAVKYPPNKGISGRVWVSREPEWIENLAEGSRRPSLRRSLLSRAKLESSLAVPILAAGRVLAVLVFRRRGRCRRDSRLMALVEAVGTQLGALMQQKQAEIDLLRVKAAVDGSSDAIVMADLGGRVLYLNRTSVEKYGYDAEELDAAGGPRKLYISAGVANAIFASIQNGRSWSGEVGMKTRSGAIVPNLVRADCIFDAAGRPIGLIAAHTDITDRRRVEETLRQKLLQERFVTMMLEQVRSSLDLNEVLQKAADKVREFLGCDRAVIYRFHADGRGWIAVESAADGPMALKGMDIRDRCFETTHAPLYRDGRTRAIADIYDADLDPCHVELLERLQVKANLVIPVLQPKTLEGEENRLWGLLIAHQCRDTRDWQEFEVACLRQVAVQLAIALQQCSLFEQVQTELAERKQAEEALRRSEARERRKAKQLSVALRELKSTQAQIVQSEKMVSLGQLVAGVAHEINNPISFIYGNVTPAMEYLSDLFELCDLYRKVYPDPDPVIRDCIDRIDLEFIRDDFLHLLRSMKTGADRIRKIVLSLRNFSRLDESEVKAVDLNEGIESTLMMLRGRLNVAAQSRDIEIVKQLGELPKIECYPSQINQVFLNLLNNAIDALEERLKVDREFLPTLTVASSAIADFQFNSAGVKISITDNGAGISEEIKSQIFDPFFTTKPVGKGTGLGLSIAHQIIVDKHGGRLECRPREGGGTEFEMLLFSAGCLKAIASR
ncbi:PAS domain S-box protein [Lyngbya sp. CCY1209]|uniref:PAS domain S-box protein n=1 Tax=Lyngbya sp. CCY1209 TaxID=2886103 RepID=UPI002D217AD6|nr:PAS domain S-box protein [Lyngbya sp. CCY1209]MEB3885873.1 PAS domain S-box protein [Lyngbya sp. CCY1209]